MRVESLDTPERLDALTAYAPGAYNFTVSTPQTPSVNDRIRAAMALRGFTQTKLAEAIGYLDQTAMSRRLSGRVRWRIEELTAVAHALDVSLGQLVGEEALL